MTLMSSAINIVRECDLDAKVALAKNTAKAWHHRRLSRGTLTNLHLPATPGRPDKPELLLPRAMPRRTTAGLKGRIALLHSLAHIELSAIDMTWDLIARSGAYDLPNSYYDDWVRVGVEEAKHFELLCRRLEALGSHYGDLPAHDGLWQTSHDTGHDLIARMAIVPLVLEARGLDVGPAMLEKMKSHGDTDSARILEIIYNDEKRHVAFGLKWFNFLCARKNIEPMPTFHHLVRKYFRGPLKPPFNDKARSQAGLTPGFYKPLASITG